MSNKATEEKLGALHGLVADVLMARLQTDEVSPQLLAQAIKFLKDNGIEAGPDNDQMNDIARQVQLVQDELDEDYA